MSELQMGSSSSSGVSLSTRGAARRERMQQDLSARRSQYFLQVQQQLFKNMFPFTADPSVRDGIGRGWGHYDGLSREAWWLQASEGTWDGTLDCSSCYGQCHDGRHARFARSFLTILIVCLEQAAHDGNWGVSYLLSLLETPPNGVFTGRIHTMPGIDRPFSPLVPQPWAACALAYIKEMDILSNKKTELRSTGKPKQQPAAPNITKTEDAEKTPSPRRRPKFPKKPGSPDPKAA